MAKLADQYTDIKNISHSVEHIILPMDHASDREHIVEELLYVLTKPNKSLTEVHI